MINIQMIDLVHRSYADPDACAPAADFFGEPRAGRSIQTLGIVDTSDLGFIGNVCQAAARRGSKSNPDYGLTLGFPDAGGAIINAPDGSLGFTARLVASSTVGDSAGTTTGRVDLRGCFDSTGSDSDAAGITGSAVGGITGSAAAADWQVNATNRVGIK